MNLKKIISKLLIMIMLLSFLNVPTVHAKTSAPNLTVKKKTLWINGEVNIDITNKVSGSKYTWTTSDSSIATVDTRGIVTGLKSGKVDVICTVKTKSNTYKLVSHITISNSSIIVKNQNQLEESLNNNDINKIMIQTSWNDKFIIPEKDFSDIRLYIKAPLAEIENNGKFKSVHAYVNNQGQLKKALTDSKITIVTINTDRYEDFIINGDYTSVRLIVKAPNSNVLATGQLRKVDVIKVNTIKLPLEKKDEIIPIPTPVVDTQPPVPSEPSPSVVTPTPTPTPTPVDLATLKLNAINDITIQASTLSQTLTGTEKTDFDNYINTKISDINNASSELMVNILYMFIIGKIQNYGQETTNNANIDYQAYLAGTMTLEELYTKYGKTTDGYTYTIPENGVFYFDAGTELVYVDYQNNKTYLFAYEDAYGLALDDFKTSILDKINASNYLDVVSVHFSGCIVSYNSAEKTLCIFDPTTRNIAYFTKRITLVTKWTTDGKIYYGNPEDPSSLNYIFTDYGTSSTINVINNATSLDLYMNNATEVNKVVFKGTTISLDNSYYTVDYKEDNTAIITFNEAFYNDYFDGKEPGYTVRLIIYPSVSTDCGTELTLVLN